MIRVSELKLPLPQAEQPEAPLREQAARLLGIAVDDVASLAVFKRSFDARKGVAGGETGNLYAQQYPIGTH